MASDERVLEVEVEGLMKEIDGYAEALYGVATSRRKKVETALRTLLTRRDQEVERLRDEVEHQRDMKMQMHEQYEVLVADLKQEVGWEIAELFEKETVPVGASDEMRARLSNVDQLLLMCDAPDSVVDSARKTVREAAALLSEREAREPDAWICPRDVEDIESTYVNLFASPTLTATVPVYFGSPPSRHESRYQEAVCRHCHKPESEHRIGYSESGHRYVPPKGKT